MDLNVIVETLIAFQPQRRSAVIETQVHTHDHGRLVMIVVGARMARASGIVGRAA